MDMGTVGSAVRAGMAAKPHLTRILSGKTAAEDAALRPLIKASLTAAVAEQADHETLVDVLFRPFLDNGTMLLLVSNQEITRGLSAAERAWADLLNGQVDEHEGIDVSALDMARLCHVFARTLWEAIQEAAARHESPLANLATRLQLAELSTGDSRTFGAVTDGALTSGAEWRLPRGVFVGREHDLSKLDERLAHERVVVVVGPPGVGKTELAAQWLAEQPAGTSQWIDASSVSSFRMKVEDLVARLRLDHVPGEEVGVDAVLRQENVCLVLDDPTAEVMAMTLGTTPTCRVLVTAVSIPPEYAAYGQKLPPLSREDLKRLATKLDPGLSESDSEVLAELFPGQPLGIRQAAPLIELMGVARLVQILEASPADGQRLGSVVGPRANLAALWEHSLNRSGQPGAETSRSALALMHLLGAYAVPVDAFLGVLAVATAEPGEELGSESECWQLIGTLSQLRLVDVEAGWISAHGLLRGYCWATLSDEDQYRCVVSATTALTDAVGFMIQHGHSFGLVLLELVANVSSWLDPTRTPPRMIDMMRLAVDLALQHGHRELGLALAESALETAGRGGDEVLVAALINLKLHVLESLASQQSLALLDEYGETMGGEGLPADVRCVFHATATRILVRFNQVEQAQHHVSKAFDALAAEGGEQDDQLLALAHRVAGMVDGARGDLGSADQHLERSFELITDQDGVDTTGLELAKYAVRLFTRLGAEERARAWRERLLKQVDLGPPVMKFETAVVLGEAGRLDEAIELIEAYVEELDHFDSGWTKVRQAEALNMAGRLFLDGLLAEEAKPFLERALEKLSQAADLPSSVPHRADVLDNLATCAILAQDYVRAAKLAAQALKLDGQYYGRDHHEYAMGLMTLATAQMHLGLHNAAQARMRQAREIWSTPGPSYNPRMLDELTHLGDGE